MKLRALRLAGSLTVILAGVSTAAAEAPAAAAAGESDAVTAADAPPPAPPASPTTENARDSTDTRGLALRAYQQALESRKLSASVALSTQRLQSELPLIEEKLGTGRRDEAIADLVYLVESARFAALEKSQEGRAATFLLGDALADAGATQPARGYLTRLLSGDADDSFYRMAVHSLVDIGLTSDRPEALLDDLQRVPPNVKPELAGDIAYLRGRAAELQKKPEEALAAYAQVGEKARYWAQATYLSGVLEVERKNFKRGEQLFCKVADPKQTPRRAAVFGGAQFFRVRDLARLGLGRLAHEEYRFDDARYYYYLVPNDSDNLPEALYETATTRYEAKDYEGARQALDDLARLKVDHVYEDEAYILDSYVDLATCRFPQADKKLDAFLKRYEPVRDAARKLSKDDAAVRALVEAVRASADPASAGLGVPEDTARALGALLRVDAGYGRAARRLLLLDHQLSGLRRSMSELDDAGARLRSAKEVHAQSDTGLSRAPADEVQRIEAQVSELKRLMREAERSGRTGDDLSALGQELAALEVRARAARASLAPSRPQTADKAADLAGLIDEDRRLASELYESSSALRLQSEEQQVGFARDALARLELRLSRLLARARLGRIETVLGKKRALEVEIDALSRGLLPRTIVDSLDAQRFLGDDEEYWPFEGEDWADEYVGGEGLR